jgi:hypothetical protein
MHKKAHLHLHLHLRFWQAQLAATTSLKDAHVKFEVTALSILIY